MPPITVSLCVIVIEVAEDSPLVSSISYLAPKYREMAASGNGGKGELVFTPGEKKKTRGLRQPTSMSIETYSSENAGTSASTITYVAPARGDVEQMDSETKKLTFLSGNPFVEVTKGILHLYKENERTPLDKLETGRSEMLLMIAVPASLSCRDLLQFVAPFQGDIELIKIIRDSFPNQYMVLIKFKSQKNSDSFYQALNGTAFNSFEDDLCNLAYVARVETMKDSGNVGLPLVGHTELPTCPVCLERMDESVDGVLTILCNHSFHSACLSKWSDARCPVCRFVQTPELVAQNQCFECKSSESLWICLICGHIGCGRYVHGHAYKHFCETSHCYAIQPDNNRVWDYVGDNFVHRLLQDKDGKLVELAGGRDHPRLDDSCEDNEEKLDSIQLEFTYMLTTQLESQRYYFEEKLAAQSKDMQRELEKLHIRLEENEKYKDDMESKVSNLVKEKTALEKKIAQNSQKLVKATAELKEEKELNKHLKNDHESWQNLVKKLETEHERYVKEKTAEITDLKEQLRDVMFFLEGQKVIAESPMNEELTGGQVTVGPSAAPSRKERRKKR